MSAGILELDTGFVSGGGTWHGLPQYKVIPDRPITMAEALEVADYPILKRPLFRKNMLGEYEEAEAWEVIRTDHDAVLVPHVGSKFSSTSNKFMLSYIDEHLLAQYPDLKIESVGTLFNGATFFLNLKVYEFQIKGDKSPTITNLMYANPLGRGAYIGCAHNTRIVCNNTERVAETQGLTNESLKRFRHTASAAQQINDHLVDMAALKLGLQQHEEQLNFLAGIDITQDDIEKFMDFAMPFPEVEGRARTNASAARTQFMHIFEGGQANTMNNGFTKYGLYCAYTDFTDHYNKGASSDEGAILFDSLMGQRAGKKQSALDWLAVA